MARRDRRARRRRARRDPARPRPGRRCCSAARPRKPALVLRVDVTNVYEPEPPAEPFSLLVDDAVGLAVRLDAACVVRQPARRPGPGRSCAASASRTSRRRAPRASAPAMPLMVEPLVLDPTAGGYKDDGDPERIVALVRQAAEIGADLIKADTTDDLAEYARIVTAAGVPLLLRGGGRVRDERDPRAHARADGQGAAGIVYGRNIIQHHDPGAMVRALQAVVHEDATPGRGRPRAVGRRAGRTCSATRRRIPPNDRRVSGATLRAHRLSPDGQPGGHRRAAPRACRCSRRSRPTTCAASPRSRCRGASPPGRSSSARATRATPATSCARGHARAIREHADGRTITLANFGPGDIFGELAMFDDERRSATVEALDERRGDRDPRRRHAPPACASTPTSRSKLVDRARPPPARGQRAPRPPVLPDRPEPRRRPCSPQLVDEAQAEGAGERDVLVTATQADVAQLAGSSRESASRFLAVLERAGVITQGRGRLTVHDPGRARALCLLSGPRRRAADAEFSAGGVVVRGDETDRDRADAPRRRRPTRARAAEGPRRPGETPEQAALREVREETGRRGRAGRASSATSRYWYQRERPARSPRRVTLLPVRVPSRATLEDHDDEVEEARWMPLEEAARRAHATRASARWRRGRCRRSRSGPVGCAPPCRS